MLGKKSTSDEFNGFLDRETSLTGELQFSGRLRIDGNFHGSITTPDFLVIGEGATVHADIKAGEVHIHGTVSGNIDCERRIEVYAKGRLRGDVRAPQLIIEEGGAFEGFSRTLTESDADETLGESSDDDSVSVLPLRPVPRMEDENTPNYTAEA